MLKGGFFDPANIFCEARSIKLLKVFQPQAYYSASGLMLGYKRLADSAIAYANLCIASEILIEQSVFL